ncbi:MAG: SLBB domain-containing protein [Acidobacteria bacterium]|nr:SLBB domain-containing protein [Acidobacteriota bacterium]MBK8810173.1 SLBB domain-containing protein [Acidobacteriota bacterium]
MKFCFFLLVLTFTATLAFGQTPNATPNRGYLIGPGDRISVRTLGETEFSWEGWVDENGKFQVPGSNDGIMAKCLSEDELRNEVAKYVSKYLKNPQMSVFVSERKSRPPVTVYGEVRQPGPVQLTRRATLRELLAFAGGETKESSGMIQVTRTQPLLCSEESDEDWKTLADRGVGFPSRLYSLSSLKNINPEVFPGDIIDVQKASVVYVVGEVNKPGELYIPEGGLRLLQALAMASGTTRDAKRKELKVIRRKEGSAQPEVIAINYDTIKKGERDDVILQPFDIVEVGKAKESIGDIFLKTLTGLPGRIPLPIRPF